ncbi:hybrid sensor histidine kinase/response regulator [Chitinasiproducens palmae]|uniref:histidine kinase n=1 Tax=Chitinasiproducens palmae TaxID=1770053 RepID=A0A1H2PY21_9BURK|nr:ATP-binding protein [Chitinasiproducens palmae]SDV51599.1 PAS domain S-box-containing protein [Chitinasiproducens palmae]
MDLRHRQARFVAALWPYLLALVTTGVVALPRFALHLGHTSSLLPFIGSVVVSAWFGGIEAGLIATALGTVAGLPWLSKRQAFDPSAPAHADVLMVGLFIVSGILISAALASLRLGRARLLDGSRRLAAEVDERRRAEADARRQRDWFGVTLDSIGDGVIITDTNGRVATMNAVAEALTGYRLSDAQDRPLRNILRLRASPPPVGDNVAPFHAASAGGIGRAWHEAPVPADKPAQDAPPELRYDHAASEAAPFAPDERDEAGWPTLGSGVRWRAGRQTIRTLLSRDGIERPVELSIAAIHDDDGNAGRDPAEDGGSSIVVFRDITDRYRAEAKVRASEERLADFFENVDVGLNLVDARGTILRANQSMLELLSCQRENYVGQPLSRFWQQPERFEGALARLLAGDSVRNVEGTLLGRDGKTHDVLLDANGHWDGSRFQYARCVIRDISDRKRAELEAGRLMESLRAADRNKDEFIAVLAHELRNPLAPISACIDILSRHPDEASAQRARDIMSRQINQMVRLVDDLLQISRITHNRLELRRERVSLQRVIDSAVEASRTLIDTRAHSLRVDTGDTPLIVDADPARLAQVFSNLLNNAAKFTLPGGRIELTARAEGSEACVTVQDNGVGIPADMLDQVFDTFTRIEPSEDVVPGGLGLGLSLVRKLTRLHGGHVSVASEGLGHGATFRVWLPLLATDPLPSQAPQAAASAARPLRILVVDDNLDAAEALDAMLALDGHETQRAPDGETALTLIETFRPELVFLDIGLPGISGYECATRIRAMPWGARTTLVALTGYGQDKDVRQAREAGFDDHLVKPASAAAIQRMVSVVASFPTPVPAAVPHPD